MSFVSNAIRFQESSETVYQAEKSLSISCRMCSERGLMYCDCETCPIQHAHNARIDALKAINLLNQERGALT